SFHLELRGCDCLSCRYLRNRRRHRAVPGQSRLSQQRQRGCEAGELDRYGLPRADRKWLARGRYRLWRDLGVRQQRAADGDSQERRTRRQQCRAVMQERATTIDAKEDPMNKNESEWREQLYDEQYHVLREHGTDRKSVV